MSEGKKAEEAGEEEGQAAEPEQELPAEETEPEQEAPAEEGEPEQEAPVEEGEAAAEGEAEEAEEPDPLAAALEGISELKDKLLRAVAETENVRRRAERDRVETRKYAISDFARDVLSVADNLRRAIESVPEEARENDEALGTLIEGVALIERELAAALERHEIQPIEPLGEKFDHNWHQAVVELEDPSKPPGTIVQVIQTGYKIADRLLRPAMVAVAKGGGNGEEDAPGVDTTV